METAYLMRIVTLSIFNNTLYILNYEITFVLENLSTHVSWGKCGKWWIWREDVGEGIDKGMRIIFL